MTEEQQAAALCLIQNATTIIRDAQDRAEQQLGAFAFGVVQQTLDSLSSCFPGELADAIRQLVAVMDRVY